MNIASLDPAPSESTIRPDQSTKPKRRKVEKAEFLARLIEHKKWLDSHQMEGKQFISGIDEDLSDEDLSGAQLSRANLTMAGLRGTNLTGADLSLANLSLSDMSLASLFRANLNKADLTGTDLTQSRPWLADLREADLNTADLSGAILTAADLRGAILGRATFNGANLVNADLCGANLFEANLDNAHVRNAKLIGVRGLFGRGRAGGLGTVKGAEWAMYKKRSDFAHWAMLRFIGTMHLFSASYVVFVAVNLYATVARWLNAHVGHWHAWAAEHKAGEVREFAGWIARVPPLPAHREFGWLLLATGLLALATTLYAIFCPEPIKEATETRWTRELNQPLIEYRSAMCSYFWARYTTFICFGLGGAYTLGYILWRAWRAVEFMLLS